jgi:hypothetical protein
MFREIGENVNDAAPVIGIECREGERRSTSAAEADFFKKNAISLDATPSAGYPIE